jgi:hypothetical protein
MPLFAAVNSRHEWISFAAGKATERDLQLLSSIAALPDFRRLMRAACLRLGQLA